MLRCVGCVKRLAETTKEQKTFSSNKELPVGAGRVPEEHSRNLSLETRPFPRHAGESLKEQGTSWREPNIRHRCQPQPLFTGKEGTGKG